MNTEVHEGTKVRHIGDSTFEFHSLFQIGNILDVFTELRHNEFVTRITAGLQQLFTNVADSEISRFAFERFEVNGIDLRRIFDKIVHRYTERISHTLDKRVRFRVHCSAIQRVLAVLDTQETGGLFEGLVTKPINLA